MSTTLFQFADEIRRDIDAFEVDYFDRHKENPENYPLELPDWNSGLWSEFFMDFHLQSVLDDGK